ncbi:MAG: HD domain-containing protein [Rhodothermales bacterium]
MTPLFSPLVERAIELAAEWHDRTYRKSRWRAHPFDPPPEVALRIPVMAHLTAVALTVQRAGWDDETVAAAFLHDALEDGNQFRHTLTFERLADLVGEGVAERVLGVTEPQRGPDGKHLPWRVRKDAYVETLRAATPEVAAISLADKLHNAWTMNQGIQSGVNIFADGPTNRKLSAGPDEQRWFFRTVLDTSEAFIDPRLDPMRERLRQEIERFERLTSDEG